MNSKNREKNENSFKNCHMWFLSLNGIDKPRESYEVRFFFCSLVWFCFNRRDSIHIAVSIILMANNLQCKLFIWWITFQIRTQIKSNQIGSLDHFRKRQMTIATTVYNWNQNSLARNSPSTTVRCTGRLGFMHTTIEYWKSFNEKIFFFFFFL